MVNQNIITLAGEESEGEEISIVNMCVAIDNLNRRNQTLEDNVFYIQQRQQEIDTTDKVEMLDL